MSKRKESRSSARKSHGKQAAGVASKQAAGTAPKKGVDRTTSGEVSSPQQSDASAIPQAAPTSTAAAKEPQQEKEVMTLTYKSLSKNGRAAFYTGAVVPIRFSLAAFPGKQAPASIEVADGTFAQARQPKAKLTKEERAALPKPTLAERAARARDRADKLAAKLAAAGQPAL